MAKRQADARDPRFRPYRVTMYLVYLVVVVGFSSLVIANVVRSVIAMTPPRLPPAEQTLTVLECLDRAEQLWSDLDARRKEYATKPSVREADADWPAFRLEWLKKHHQVESECALESRQRSALKSVFTRLERAMDLYTTHTVQYAGEIGPTVDALRAAREQARKEATK